MGKEKTLIDCAIGVKQGDNLAWILFIIVMQFLAEILEQKLKENNIYMPNFIHDTNDYHNKGQLSHKIKKCF